MVYTQRKRLYVVLETKQKWGVDKNEKQMSSSYENMAAFPSEWEVTVLYQGKMCHPGYTFYFEKFSEDWAKFFSIGNWHK